MTFAATDLARCRLELEKVAIINDVLPLNAARCDAIANLKSLVKLRI